MLSRNTPSSLLVNNMILPKSNKNQSDITNMGYIYSPSTIYRLSHKQEVDKTQA